MAFKNRWRINGTLITITPLHVGSGETTMRDALVDDSNALVPVDIAAVATDHRHRAYIPGTTLKGNLRAWLNMHGISSSAIEAVFGSAEPGTSHAVGGKAEVWDALAVGISDPPPQVPYWDGNRLTGVSVAVAIDRRTRTASPNKLFHEEFVPPGISFEVTVTGQDLEPGEPELLLYALEGFNHTEHPIALGAGTGDGHGRFTWKLNDIARIETQEDIIAWLQQPNPPVGYDGLVSLTDAARDAIVMRALNRRGSATQSLLTLTLNIHFDGPFLVNDPSRTKKGRPRSAVDEDLPNHAPLRDHKGRLMLPASSIRGALRSQAEKILRTLNGQASCLAVDSEDACAPIYIADQSTTHLCLACQVFGAPGWRAPVAFSDFLPVQGSGEVSHRQEFLAIDRFTGGGADGLKFNAVAVYRPMLTGTMSVHLDRRVEPWALGLLALTLRDLIEGDIPLGFGAAKGFGACRAVITGVRVVGLNALSTLQAILQDNEATQVDFNSLDTTARPLDEVQLVVMALVQAFQEKVSVFQRPVLRTGGQDAVS